MRERAAVGTWIQEGGFPIKYKSDGSGEVDNFGFDTVENGSRPVPRKLALGDFVAKNPFDALKEINAPLRHPPSPSRPPPSTSTMPPWSSTMLTRTSAEPLITTTVTWTATGFDENEKLDAVRTKSCAGTNFVKSNVGQMLAGTI